MEKLGVFVCSGCDIGASIKLDGFEGLAKKAGAATYLCHDSSSLPSATSAAALASKRSSNKKNRPAKCACPCAGSHTPHGGRWLASSSKAMVAWFSAAQRRCSSSVGSVVSTSPETPEPGDEDDFRFIH